MRDMKQGFAKTSENLLKKRLFLGALFLCVVASSNNAEASPPSHAIIKSACSSALYPELCISSITSEHANVTDKLLSHKDVIKVALDIGYRFVHRNYLLVGKLLTRKGLSARVKSALKDCLETIGDTLDEITKAKKDLQDYPSQAKSLYRHADDLKTLISSAITNHVTCLDGFSHNIAAKRFRKLYLLKAQLHAQHLCSNALAMTKNLTDTDITMSMKERKMEEEQEDGVRWPEWISEADKRLLQSDSVSSSRYVIRIKAGVYRENVDVPSSKTNIMFLGDGRSNTIITASRNVIDGSTTFNSATVAAVGDGFLARGITFENTAGPSKEQAVATRAGSDLAAFYLCGFIAYQDTLYVHSNRQFFVKCYVAGTVDFIFGNSAAVLQDCDINARRPGPKQKNTVTAQGRVDANQNTGIVIQKCRINATTDLYAVKSTFRSFLGRPWQEYSRTVVMQSSISDIIDPAGWLEWNGTFALDTLYYGEYHNTGAGASTSQRVTWKGFKVITTASEAETFTPQNFISASNWLPSTGFPFSLGL